MIKSKTSGKEIQNNIYNMKKPKKIVITFAQDCQYILSFSSYFPLQIAGNMIKICLQTSPRNIVTFVPNKFPDSTSFYVISIFQTK